MNSLSVTTKNDNGGDANRFPSFTSLRVAHGKLLIQYRQQEDKAALFPSITKFICHGRSTGALLDGGEDRLGAQSLLDYWSSILYRAGFEPPEATLADFDLSLAPELDDSLCPYRGLDAFREKDRQFFYGRQRLLDQLLQKLQENQFLALVGSSGSGKSSVVLGGLIPSLKAGKLPGSENWHYYVSMMPGSNPLTNLARLFCPEEVEERASIEKQIEQQARQLLQNSNHLTQLLSHADGQPSVLVIDQFEEVFTLCQDRDIRQAFINNLVALVQAPESSRCCVILTMRSDFENQVAKLPNFQPIFEAAQVRVLPLDASELREAIEKPAERVGLKFEDGLVDQLINDVLGEPAALPLLQFTLLKLWNDRERNRITQKAYKRLGGGRLALSNSADEFYNKLIPEEQVTCKRIFLKMVRPTEGLEVTSSRIPIKELYRAGEAGDRVERVLNKLIEARLVRQTEGNTPNDTQVEVAHEALIRNWRQLVEWLEDARVNLRQRLRLKAAAAQWEEKDRDQGALLRGALLEEARQYDDLTELETQFFSRSIEYEKNKKNEKNKLRNKITIASIIAAFVCLSLAVFAVYQWRNAELNQANSLGHYSSSLSNEGKGLDALVEAIKAEKILQNQHATDPEVRLALQQAVYERSERNRLEGHNDSVRSVSFSPNGQLIATASGDSTVKLWKTDGENLHTFTVQNQLFRHVTFNTDGTMIAAISADNTIKVWGIDGQEVGTVNGQDNEENFMSGICFVPKTNIIAASGPANTVKLWRINGQKLQLIKTLEDHRYPVWSISCSKDGKIVTADQGGFLALWSIDGKELRKPFLGKQSIYGVSFSPDGQTFATAGGDTMVRLWNLNGQELKILGRHNNQVTSVSFSRDGKTVASTSMDNTVKLWSLDGNELKTLKGHGDPVYSVSFSPDDNTLASASDDNTVKLWNIGDLEPKTFFGHRDSLYSVSFSPDGKTIASAGVGVREDNIIKLWSADGQELKSFKANSDREWNQIWSLSFSSDGQTIATANNDKTIMLWSLNGQKLKTFKGHKGEVIDVSFSPKDKILASASYDGTVKLWGMNGKCIATFNGHAGKVRSVSFSPDGKTIVSAHNDGTIKLWNLAEKEEQEPRTFTGHSAYVTDVRFSPDGKIIASASRDKIIKLWSLDGQELRTLQGHTGAVNRVSFSPDSKILASASTDYTIRLWDLANGQEIKTLRRPGYSLNNVSFSPDGKKVVSVSDDALVELWNAETQDSPQLISQGCNWLHDYLKNDPRADKHTAVCSEIGDNKAIQK
jgi:WD40 repeat protein/energy-coupling factor transporter ATP-binding protein EcfA2